MDHAEMQLQSVDFASDKRSATRVPVDLLLNKYVKGRPYLCRASDLGPEGLRLQRIHEPHSEETEVGLQFQLPGCELIITCAGRIVHDEGSEGLCGVRFTSVAPEHQKLIDEFILGQLGVLVLPA